ncbi:DUF6634 family protein [Halovulum sp. GXIMD14794]
MTHPTDLAARIRAALDASGTAPAPDTLAAAPLIDPWQVAVSPHAPVATLLGSVTDHPRLPDGPIDTSVLLALDPQGRWARTLSRWYRLGTPYAEATPPAEATAHVLGAVAAGCRPLSHCEAVAFVAAHRERLRAALGSG